MLPEVSQMKELVVGRLKAMNISWPLKAPLPESIVTEA
jgi:hypothetical protein